MISIRMDEVPGGRSMTGWKAPKNGSISSSCLTWGRFIKWLCEVIILNYTQYSISNKQCSKSLLVDDRRLYYPSIGDYNPRTGNPVLHLTRILHGMTGVLNTAQISLQ